MTYEEYKEDLGKLTKAVRSKHPIFAHKLRLEELHTEQKKAGIAAWKARADIINDGDLDGLLYDKLSETREDLRVARLQLRDITETITEYKRNEHWGVAENV